MRIVLIKDELRTNRQKQQCSGSSVLRIYFLTLFNTVQNLQNFDRKRYKSLQTDKKHKDRNEIIKLTGSIQQEPL